MTQGSVILIGSLKIGRSSYLAALMPTEYEADSSVGVDTNHLFRMLKVGSIPSGKTTCGILAARDMVLRKWFQEYLEKSERLNHLVDRIRDCLANEVRDYINDEFDDCISDEDLNYIVDKANDKIKDQITQALCDVQSRVQDKMRQGLRSQYLEVLRETMCEYIDSNLENEEGISHDAYMCPIRSLRDIKRKCIRTTKNVMRPRVSKDVFRRLFNLIRKWTSRISMKWERMTHTRLSLEVQRRYRSCVADSFQIGTQWQDVWKTPALTLFVP